LCISGKIQICQAKFEGRIEMRFPPFDGTENLNEYLAWERKVQSIYLYYDYSEDEMVELASVEFRGYASHWWEKVNYKRLQR